MGIFKDGLQHGYGVLTSPSGDYYEGEFRGNFKDGKGTFYNVSQGYKSEGRWKRDKRQPGAIRIFQDGLSIKMD